MLKHVVDLGIPAGIFVLMLIAGTEMAVRDFVLLVKHPRDFAASAGLSSWTADQPDIERSSKGN